MNFTSKNFFTEFFAIFTMYFQSTDMAGCQRLRYHKIHCSWELELKKSLKVKLIFKKRFN